jgi:hypothetical protein
MRSEWSRDLNFNCHKYLPAEKPAYKKKPDNKGLSKNRFLGIFHGGYELIERGPNGNRFA